jgi:hypothetical protein
MYHILPYRLLPLRPLRSIPAVEGSCFEVIEVPTIASRDMAFRHSLIDGYVA